MSRPRLSVRGTRSWDGTEQVYLHVHVQAMTLGMTLTQQEALTLADSLECAVLQGQALDEAPLDPT